MEVLITSILEFVRLSALEDGVIRRQKCRLLLIRPSDACSEAWEIWYKVLIRPQDAHPLRQNSDSKWHKVDKMPMFWGWASWKYALLSTAVYKKQLKH